MSVNERLNKYYKFSFSQKEKGEQFEHFMHSCLFSDSIYANKFKKVRLWNEFLRRNDLRGIETGACKVEKMRFLVGKKSKDQSFRIIYKSKITISNIPAEAYEYVVSGKSFIE